jgi:hypothetical protein
VGEASDDMRARQEEQGRTDTRDWMQWGAGAQYAIRWVGDQLRRLERRIAEFGATPPGSVPGQGGTSLEPAWARDPSVGETQEAICEAATELRRVEGRIGWLCEILPEPGHEFEPLAELWEVLDCVKRDRLADAIRTLEVAANQDEDQLRREYDRRQEQLADPRRFG